MAKSTFKQELYELNKAAGLAVNQANPNPMTAQRYESMFGHKWKHKKPTKASQIETLICDFMRLKGHGAAKVSTTGVYRDNTKVITNVIGQRVKVGSKGWTHGQATKGASDLNLIVYGLNWSVEVKFRKDRQSDNQKTFEKMIQKAGGFYSIVRTLDDFYEQYYNFLELEQVKIMKQFNK